MSSVQWEPRTENKKTVSFQAEPELLERLSEFCKESGISKSDFLRLATSNMLNKLA